MAMPLSYLTSIERPHYIRGLDLSIIIFCRIVWICPLMAGVFVGENDASLLGVYM
jgi:hypothetical protein